MKAILISRRIDERCNTGFERYAFELCSELLEHGVDVSSIADDSSRLVRPYGSLISPFYFEIFHPILSIVRGVHSDVFHAISESKGCVFPFIRGKKVVTFHHMVGKTPSGKIGERVFNIYWHVSTRISLKYADHIICISEQSKDELISNMNISPVKISVVNHGVSSDFSPGHTRGPKGLNLGIVGALVRRKNVDKAVELLAELHRRGHDDAKLTICGSGPEEQNLRNLVQGLDMNEHVVFVKDLTKEQLIDLYRSLDFLIFPSLQEGFGFPILEAQRCGTPVVIFKHAMLPNEVTDACIKINDIDDMASSIIIIGSDAEKWIKISVDSFTHADRFTWKNAASRTIDIYRGLEGCSDPGS